MKSDILQISIAIIDDHPILRHGLAAVLRSEPGFKVVAEGGCSTEALQIANMHRPNIMLLDLGIPGNGIEALKEICVQVPSTRCIILTVCDNADTAINALNSGAQGYILKGIAGEDLKAAIRTVLNNESFVSPDFAAKLVIAAQREKVALTQAGSQLNFREVQILREVEAGLTNRMVAEKLKISEKTVKYYMTNIMQKYGVSNRTSAVVADQRLRMSRPNA
ncbi:response regulator transcription factor [Tardiphaga sp. vice154]|uniref:response regulator n=1 Tax=Tardiphaga sp. vice154 TaxID=2592814 RepID=UPI001163FF81|nr:response regulator transcription factor [Tardiphaga sp. vice154]QDM23143.1 response regulator transcription factor [Tardiphaga sp. vice154]